MFIFINPNKAPIPSTITEKLALGLMLGMVRVRVGLGQARVQVSLKVRVRRTTDMVVKAADMRGGGVFTEENSGINVRGQMSDGDDCPGVPLKCWFIRT